MRFLMLMLVLGLAGCGADDPPAGGAPAVGTISTGIEPL